MTSADKLIEQGRIEGQTKMLRSFLVNKFGQLTPEAEKLLASGTQRDADPWSQRLFTAPTLKAIFEE